MALGRRKTERQMAMWIAAGELPRSQGHVFYQKLNRLLSDAGFVGEDDCLHPVADVEFGQEVADMGFRSRFADEHFGRDFAVVQAACEEAEGLQNDSTRIRRGAHRQDQGIDDHIGEWNPVVLGPLDDLLGHLEAQFGCFRDP